MIFLQVIRDYVHWHYTHGIIDYVHVWWNFLYFFYNFFSITLLLKTIINPWKRMSDETDVHITDFYEFLSRAVINITMRLIGFFVRIVFISLGIMVLIITLLVGSIGMALWFVLPIGVILLIVAGSQLLFFSA